MAPQRGLDREHATARGPAIHLRDNEVDRVGTYCTVDVAQGLGGVDHQWRSEAAADIGDLSPVGWMMPRWLANGVRWTRPGRIDGQSGGRPHR